MSAAPESSPSLSTSLAWPTGLGNAFNRSRERGMLSYLFHCGLEPLEQNGASTVMNLVRWPFFENANAQPIVEICVLVVMEMEEIYID